MRGRCLLETIPKTRSGCSMLRSSMEPTYAFTTHATSTLHPSERSTAFRLSSFLLSCTISAGLGILAKNECPYTRIQSTSPLQCLNHLTHSTHQPLHSPPYSAPCGFSLPMQPHPSHSSTTACISGTRTRPLFGSGPASS